MKVGIVILILIILLGSLIIFGDRGLLDCYKMQVRLEHLKESNYELAKETGTLKKEIMKLKSDPVYIEYIARKELGMARKGELVFQFDK